jgi:serine/threonine-protein kinase
MDFTRGSMLLHYRLVEPIGEGGMGAVWCATDEKLGRQVALKVLPEAFADDEERRARFEREARLLASLNHRNIATLYGLEQVDGRHVLVMELVEGEDLSARIRRGSMSLDEALPIALQIAEGLEAAHERGVIHRDLKPANVMIARDGTVKVLDFGLATGWDSGGAAADLTRSPTVTARMTQAGVVLGTAAYMSPEQARGLPLDRRTDIWSYGVLLFEMLSGATCFGGDTVTDILAAILKEPPDWSRISGPLPRRVRDLLGRMLDKDPHRRLRDIGDARLEIEAAMDEGDAVTTDPGRAPAPVRGRRPYPWLWLAGGVAAGGLIAAALLGFWRSEPPPAREALTRLQLVLPEGQKLAFGRRVSNTIAVAPDGRTIAVSIAPLGPEVDYYKEGTVETRLWLRPLDAPAGRIVAGSDGAMAPFFSPDGRWVAFFARGKLRKALVAGGGAVETVCDANDPWGGSWPEDDVIVFASSLSGGVLTQRVAAAGGSPQVMAELDAPAGEQEQNFPVLLPSGRSLLYMAWRAGETTFARILVLDLASGRRTTLVEGGLRPTYLPPHLIYNVGPKIFGVPMRVDPPVLDGEAVEIADNVLVDPDYDAGQWGASPSGTLVYAPGGRPSSGRRLVWVDPDGVVEPITSFDKQIIGARIAAVGRVLFTSLDVNADIYSYDLSRGTTSRITVDDAWDGNPVPSSDGDRLAFTSYRSGTQDLYILESDGTIVRPIDTQGYRWPASWSRDGRLLAFTERSPGTTTDIWLLPTDGLGADPVRLAATKAAESSATFSPTADYIAYVSDESGDDEIWMCPYPVGQKREEILVSRGGGTDPVWSRDGRRLYYQSGTGLMAIDVAYQPALRLGQPVQLLANPSLRVQDAAGDGRLLAIESELLPEVTTLEAILGFDRLLDNPR